MSPSFRFTSFEERYVQNILKQNENTQTKRTTRNCFSQFKDDTNFRFSTRVTSTYTVCFTVLFYMTCLLSFYGSIFVDMLYLPPIYARTLIVSAFFAAFICATQLILSLRSLKHHLTTLYKGSRVF